MKAFHENRMYHSAIPFFTKLMNNFSFLAHWHNDLEFVYVCEGTIRMGVNSETRILHKGDFVFCSSGDIHFYDSKDLDSSILLAVFHPQLIGSPGGWPKDVRLLSPFIDSKMRRSGAISDEAYIRMEALMRNLLAEYTAEEPYYEHIITGILHELSGILLRHAPCEPAAHKQDKRRMISMRIMQSVLDYLEAHYMHAVTLEDAAKTANMSLYHFSRFFKSISGMSFTSYLNTIRVQRAETMILETDNTMLDIALECGFTNVRTFNRVFKQVRNCRPTDLR
jgi:AraC-like DNA-binding protein